MAYSSILAVLLLGVLIGRVELRPDGSKGFVDDSDHSYGVEDKKANDEAHLDKRLLGVVANLLGVGSLGGNISGAGELGVQAKVGSKGITSDFEGKGNVKGGAGLGPGDAGVQFNAEGAVKGNAGLGPGITGVNVKSKGKFDAHGGLAQSHYGLMANEPGYKGKS